MNQQNPSQNLAARARAAWFRSGRGVALAAPKLGSEGGAERGRGLILLAGWLALVTPLRADNPPTYLYEIDSSAFPVGGYAPSAVALDSSNNIYVTEWDNSVVKLASGGLYLTQWGSFGSGNGQFEDPSGIAVDSSNNIYVADGSGLNERIQ